MNDLPLNSRYRSVETRSTKLASGEDVEFLGRRILPDPGRVAAAARHRTVEGDRLDQVAEGAWGDPLLYWRIADAAGDEDWHGATRPPGRLLIIPQPQNGGGDG
jgi:hypothetical protein